MYYVHVFFYDWYTDATVCLYLARSILLFYLFINVHVFFYDWYTDATVCLYLARSNLFMELLEYLHVPDFSPGPTGAP